MAFWHDDHRVSWRDEATGHSAQLHVVRTQAVFLHHATKIIDSICSQTRRRWQCGLTAIHGS
uniref:Uncharacterized protein n=1 Tax=Arundo donax TaxID=35708 RepID=A0A0A8Z060_ARUDO